MELIVDVLIEVGSIVLMGCICFTVYVYGKMFLIKIEMMNQLKIKCRKGVNK